MLQVFAATNSPNKKGRGEIFAFLANMQIGGVKVKIIISFEVKTVKIETTAYKIINNLNFPPF